MGDRALVVGDRPRALVVGDRAFAERSFGLSSSRRNFCPLSWLRCWFEIEKFGHNVAGAILPRRTLALLMFPDQPSSSLDELGFLSSILIIQIDRHNVSGVT
ncbi:MAG: hypothetical protein D6694_10770 [Gammaproteobacteria bacterium]|nr:MAG: hypothetical protein D6694_10770 [Gammaproteobacteria bacterium]